MRSYLPKPQPHAFPADSTLHSVLDKGIGYETRCPSLCYSGLASEKDSAEPQYMACTPMSAAASYGSQDGIKLRMLACKGLSTS